MTAAIFDDTPCDLGEGPLWHPERKQLFWFDILGNRLLTRQDGKPRHWQFDEHVSAAGWIDRDTLLIASETALQRFDLVSGKAEILHPLEANRPETRSNDGRADPWGGFWIGTMGKQAEAGAGAIYRLYRGTLRELVAPVSIPNAICFAPDRSTAYFADTTQRRIMRQSLDAEGWPQGEPSVFVDLTGEGLNPDGAVTDADGRLWNAQWGASRVAVYGPDGQFQTAVDVPARYTSCPAFGGPGLDTLYCTTARHGLAKTVLDAEPQNGMTFAIPGAGRGLAEYRVVL